VSDTPEERLTARDMVNTEPNGDAESMGRVDQGRDQAMAACGGGSFAYGDGDAQWVKRLKRSMRT
jgi:hypothetical protein